MAATLTTPRARAHALAARADALLAEYARRLAALDPCVQVNVEDPGDCLADECSRDGCEDPADVQVSWTCPIGGGALVEGLCYAHGWWWVCDLLADPYRRDQVVCDVRRAVRGAGVTRTTNEPAARTWP